MQRDTLACHGPARPAPAITGRPTRATGPVMGTQGHGGAVGPSVAALGRNRESESTPGLQVRTVTRTRDMTVTPRRPATVLALTQ
jgi:hypothetical protein